jgi:hypothetical protein
MKLKLKECRIVSSTRYPGDPDSTQVLLFAAKLTPGAADRLECRDICYAQVGEQLDGKPQLLPRKFDSYALSLTIEGADVLLGTGLQARSTLIHKLKVSPEKSADSKDISLELRGRMHFAESIPLDKFTRSQNKGTFDISIEAAQENLDFGGYDDEEDEEAEAAPEPGPVVDAEWPDVPEHPLAAPEEEERNCVLCENGIGFAEPGLHANGKPCTKAPATLAAARQLGGTHQKKVRVVKLKGSGERN